MKLTALLLATVSVVSVSASPSWIPGQVTIQNEYKVPGDNPLYFCNNPENDILEIDSVDLDPNPPKPGTDLTIKAKGTFKEQVDEGSYMTLQVKYGLITLIKQDRDLCETIKQADLECPLEKGDMSLTKKVTLPAQIPPGTYTVNADVYTVDKKLITCLKATVTFGR